MKTIEKYLNYIPLPSEKAKSFYAYVFQRTLSKITLSDEKTLEQAVLACIDRVGKSDFPLIKPNGKVLLVPVALILEDLLYTDMQMTIFFINFVRFHLLLILVHTLYPDLFDRLSAPPFPVPAILPMDHRRNARTILFGCSENAAIGPNQTDRSGSGDSEAALRFSLVQSLSGCNFLPVGTDYTPYIRPIFEGFQISV